MTSTSCTSWATSSSCKQGDIDQIIGAVRTRARQHRLAGPGPRPLRGRVALVVRAGAEPDEGGVRRRRHRVQEPGDGARTRAMAQSPDPHPAAGTRPGGPRRTCAALRSGACRSSSSPSSRSSRASPGPTSRRPSTPPRTPAPTSTFGPFGSTLPRRRRRHARPRRRHHPGRVRQRGDPPLAARGPRRTSRALT